MNAAWLTLKDGTRCKNIHIQCGLAVDMVIKSALVRRTLDNVTLVMIAFSHFETFFSQENSSELNKEIKYKNEDEEHNKVSLNSESLNHNNHLRQAADISLNSYNTNNFSSINSMTPHSNINNHNSGNSIKQNLSYISGSSLMTPSNTLHSEYNSIIRKNQNQKKLVSLDLTSSKKTNGNYSVKESNKKKLDYSEQNEKKLGNISNNRVPLFLQSNVGDYHPITTKNSVTRRDNSLMGVGKKNSK